MRLEILLEVRCECARVARPVWKLVRWGKKGNASLNPNGPPQADLLAGAVLLLPSPPQPTSRSLFCSQLVGANVTCPR